MPSHVLPYVYMQKVDMLQSPPTSALKTDAESASQARKQRRTQASLKHRPSAADLSNLLAPDTSRPGSVRDSSPAKSPESEIQSPSKSTAAEPATPASDYSSIISDTVIAPPPIGSLVEDFFSDKVEAATREALLAFFDYVYAFLPVFHPSTFIRRVIAGNVNPLLIDIIKAIAAPYISSDTFRHIDAQQLIDNVKGRILFAIENPTIDVILAVYLLYITEMRHERATSFSALMSVSIGTIVKLGWHEIDLYKTKKARTWDEWVDAETKRRIFWCVIHGDFNRSFFQGRPAMIPESVMFVRSPCADSEWIDIEFPLSPLAKVDRRRSTSVDLQDSNTQPTDQTTVTGAISHSFGLLCELITVDNRIARFLYNAKASKIDPEEDLAERPFPAVDFLSPTPGSEHLVIAVSRNVEVISEYAEFRICDQKLQSLLDRVKSPESLRDAHSQFGSPEAMFGDADYAQRALRLRCLALGCNIYSAMIILHASNRRSFFTEFDRPPELLAGLDSLADPKEHALRQVFKAAFGGVWGQGLVADDVERESWEVCVRSAHSLAGLLRNNNDIPVGRYESSSFISMVIVTSILLRQIRQCKKALKDMDAADEPQGKWARELDQCIEDVKLLWDTVINCGPHLKMDAKAMMLKAMDIDEVTKAADELASLSL
ncbi:hypothetical protein FBU59_000699 [Linderina macrospora]|uniref:Uncharacterized protein n=1 Tax=Linderina macrospora TaxID=4868 RepID=A0ACC1JGC1_9FUNG|nr:hypothetical protein FBU59_000699 [Linderina macrospora]